MDEFVMEHPVLATVAVLWLIAGVVSFGVVMCCLVTARRAARELFGDNDEE